MKKKIALISEHASPLATLGGVDNGGQNVYVAEVAKYLASIGHHVDVFTRRDDKHLDRVTEWMPGLRVIHVDAGPPEMIEKEKLLHYMDEFAADMISFIKENSISYEIAHANFFMSAYVAMKLKAQIHLPFVITFHALGLVRRAHQKEMDKFPEERFDIERQAIHRADAVIAECPQDKIDLIHYYGAEVDKIHIVPCGCNLTEFHPVDKKVARARIGVDPDEFVLLQLGRMVPRKGVENVIRAAAQLKDKIHNLRVLVVGGESDEPDENKTPEIGRLKKIANQLNVASIIRFTGRKSRSELKYYYAAADIFITTPWYEPFGITPLEAMACGTPVIGAKVGGIKYSVEDGVTGLLVPPKDPQALADAVGCLQQNKELEMKMKRNAIRRVKSMFTWEQVASKLLDVYVARSKPHLSPVVSLNKKQPIIRTLDVVLPLTQEE